ncbi:uncharacterized protein LOC118416488 [Branchiostoma floridae]|uniref:Uncharacterized protein LOC118416488 n=1 Tax=Branchiostoma floridae TaxID=7739 RepID=A0A9J7L7H9_BRAFL|nr:uncharacterized protein LOC118416488 [Branchiostoma floridae]
MASSLLVFLFLGFMFEVKCFPAAVDESISSRKENRLLAVLGRRFHFDNAEVEATKELIEDEENNIDPEQDEITFRLQVEEIVRKLRTMSDEEMERIRMVFVRNMGPDRAEKVFGAAEEIYASEKEANEELQKSFQLNEGEEEAFEELVEDTKDGRDPETEDLEFKSRLYELADKYGQLSPEQEERFRDLVEEGFGPEEAATLFQELREIHEEMETLEANSNGDDGISLAAEKVDKVADDQENMMFWGELHVDVPDEGSQGNDIDNGVEDVEDFGNSHSLQTTGANPFNAPTAGADPVPEQTAGPGATLVQEQYAGANPVQEQSEDANPNQEQPVGANPVQEQPAGANLVQEQPAGANSTQLQTVDPNANPTEALTETGTSIESNDNGNITDIDSKTIETERNATLNTMTNTPTVSTTVIRVITTSPAGQNVNSSVASVNNVANTTSTAQTNLTISENSSIDGSQRKWENISDAPTAVFNSSNVATTRIDETNVLNNITTLPSRGDNSVANDQESLSIADNVTAIETEVYSKVNASGQDKEIATPGTFPGNVTKAVELVSAVPTPIFNNSSSADSPSKDMGDNENDTSGIQTTTADDGANEDSVLAESVTMGIEDQADDEGNDIYDWFEWLTSGFRDDDDWDIWPWGDGDWTTIPMTTEAPFEPTLPELSL